MRRGIASLAELESKFGNDLHLQHLQCKGYEERGARHRSVSGREEVQELQGAPILESPARLELDPTQQQ
jgi:hypothetical protein